MSGADIDLVLQELRREAGTWDEQSETLADVARTAQSLHLSALQAGIFLVMHEAYGDTVEHVAARCREGAARTAEIASALRANAQAYERRDDEVSAHVASAY